MSDNDTQGAQAANVGTEVPASLFVGGVTIALVLIVVVAIVNVG
ncbi:MAG: hypothetical protein ACOYJQ_00980 [Pseudochelatococcus sp.]